MRRLFGLVFLTITLLGYTLFPPTLLMAAYQQQEATAIIRIENQSDRMIKFCTIFAVLGASDKALQGSAEQMTLASGASKEFALPPGQYRLLITDCKQKSLFSQEIELIDTFVVTLSGETSTIRQQSNRQTDDTNTFRDPDLLYELGAYYYGQRQNTKALKYFLQALPIQRELGKRADESNTLSIIGLLYASQGQHDKALEYFLQALPLHQELGNRADESKILYYIGSVYAAQGQNDKALEYYLRTLSIQQELGNLAEEADTLHNIGWLYYSQGQNDKALEYYLQALPILQELLNFHGEGVTLNNIGLVYATQGRNPDALEYFEQALIIHQAVGNRREEGTTLTNIGQVYAAQEQNAKALELFQQALTIHRAVGNQVGEVMTLDNMNGVYLVQGQYRRALAYYQQTLAAHRTAGNQTGEVLTLNNIGYAYLVQGQYNQALNHLKQALLLARSIHNRNLESVILLNISLVYSSSNRYADAIENSQQALIIVRAVSNQILEGTIINHIGFAYSVQGQFSQALDNFQQALTIARAAGQRSMESTALNNIAMVHHKRKEYIAALNNFEQALTISQTIGNKNIESLALTNIASVYRDQKEYAQALKYFQQALVLEQEYDNPSLESLILLQFGYFYYVQGQYTEAQENYQRALALRQTLGDNTVQASILAGMGITYHEQGQDMEALHSYQNAMDLLENTRAIAGSEQGRISFIASYAELYERAVMLYVHQGQPELAFFTSERGRARVFLDSLATGAVQLSDEEANTLLTQEQEAYAFRQAIQDALIHARAANSPDPKLIAELEKQLQEAEQQHAAALSAIEARSDQLTALVPGRTKHVLALNDVQTQLPDQTTLLSYWLGADKGLAFLITADDFSVVELPDATMDNLAAIVANLYQWRNPDNPHPLPLRQLYQVLIAPLADKLKTTHLAIIPHQLLHYIPFAALTDGERYFGQQHILTVLPSASVLPFLKQNAANVKHAANPTALVFGNPQTDLPALPASEAEATAVAELFNTTVYTGMAASELYLHTAVSGTTILHLAAHGSYSQTNALYNAIYLAPSPLLTPTQPLTQTTGLPTVDTTRDGRLETREIFGLPLNGTDLVTLSACETSVGDLSRGDDLVGLTRAFFFAGTPTVISSLWNVNDAATERLMVSFYKHWLQEDMSKAEALQAAQADVRANPRWASPFYWAGFVLNGDLGQRN